EMPDRADVKLQRELAELYALLIESPAWRQRLAEQAVAYVGARAAGGEPSPEPKLPSHLRQTAFAVAVETEGAPFAESLLTLFHDSGDALLRQEILYALSLSGDGAMLARLRELVLSEALRDNEVEVVLGPQFREADSRDDAWRWLLANF